MYVCTLRMPDEVTMLGTLAFVKSMTSSAAEIKEAFKDPDRKRQHGGNVAYKPARAEESYLVTNEQDSAALLRA